MSATGGGGAGGGGQEEDKKPADQSAHINLKVKGQVLLSRILDHHFLFIYLFILLAAYLRLLCLLMCFVCLQDGNEVFFRIKRSTQLRKLMTAYCDRQSVDLSSIAFLFDGRRLRGEQTPDEVKLLGAGLVVLTRLFRGSAIYACLNDMLM